MVMSLRSKWAVGKARGGRISESIRNRRATQPPAHFQRNPPAAASWLFFRVARSTRMTQIWALRSRLEKQPTDLRRHHHYMRDGTLVIDLESEALADTSQTQGKRVNNNKIYEGSSQVSQPP